MSGVAEWFRKFGHRLCKTQVPDKFLVPQLAGNIETAELRHFKKLVQRGRLAPFYPGRDEPSNEVVECPICCTYYRVMNKTKCCGQRICSECIVKIRLGCPLSGIACPFCKKSGLDVDICEGKSDAEKHEELLDEQRFAECRLRQLEEANGHRDLEEIEDGGPAGDAIQTAAAVATTVQESAHERGSNTSTTPQTQRDSQLGAHNAQTTTHSIQDDFRQEQNLLRRRVTASSNLSNSELQRCEDYLGVCPEDLGLRVDEFNDLLLEQTLISSMIEMKKSETTRQEEETRRRPAEGTSDQGASSSSAVRGDNATPSPQLNPSPRSHSLPLAHPLADVDNATPETEETPERCWSLENVFRQVSSTSPFSLLANLRGSSGGGESSREAAAAPPLSPFSTLQLSQPSGNAVPREEEEDGTTEVSSQTESSVDPGESLKNLLNSMAGFNNVNTQFRMMTVTFDDPVIEAAMNGRPVSDRRRSQSDVEAPAGEAVTGHQVTQPVAVENPDGSMALISVACDESQAGERTNERLDTSEAGESSHDAAVIRAMQEADRSQMNAIEEADARLRQLYSQNRGP